MTYKKIGFIAPSTCLSVKEKPALNRTARLLRKSLGAQAVYFSSHLFSSDAEIDHVTAPVKARAEVFKEAIRELDLIISVAGERAPRISSARSTPRTSASSGPAARCSSVSPISPSC